MTRVGCGLGALGGQVEYCSKVCRRTPALVALMVAVGCSRQDRTVLDVPATVRSVALVEDAGSEGLRASGLAPWAPGAGLPAISETDHPLFVLGYTDEQLAPLTAGVPHEDLARPLEITSGCRQALPLPVFAAHIVGGEAPAMVEGDVLPALSAPWLDPICGAIDHEGISVDVSCLGYCEPRTSARGPCTIELDLDRCGVGHTSVTLSASGGGCLEVSEARGWHCAPAASDGLASAECDSPVGRCRIDVYVQPEAPPFSVERRALFDVALHVPSGVRARRHYSNDALSEGYLVDLVTLRDRVLVAEGGGERVDRRAARWLTALDLTTMQTIERFATEPKLGPMARDPIGEGFVATYASGAALRLGRFDASGRRTADAALAASTSTVTAIIARATEIAVVLQTTAGGEVLIHETEGLALRSRSLADEALHHATFVDAQAVAVSKREREVIAVDVTTGAPRWTARIPNRPARDNTEIVAIQRTADGIVAALTLDVPSVRAIGTDGSVNAVAEPIDRPMSPQRFHQWPLDSKRLVVAGSDQDAGEPEAFVTFMDSRAHRFSPGTYAVGQGAVTRIDADERGRLWLLLPWSAEIVRLSPTR